jgi:hypothetical protein
VTAGWVVLSNDVGVESQDMDRVNRLLWVSCLCILWGLPGMIVELASEGKTQITPSGLPGATLLMIGIITGAISQVLFQLTTRIEILEHRLSEKRDQSSP